MSFTEFTDPLGRRIVFQDQRWEGHISASHPDVAMYRHLAERAVRSPLIITITASDSHCRRYYGRGPRPNVMIQVIADVTQGFVKTAYLCRKIDGGIVEWSPPKP